MAIKKTIPSTESKELKEENQKKVESITQKTISAVHAIDAALGKITELPKLADTLKETVSQFKNEMDLGLKIYSQQIEEKVEVLNEQYRLRQEQLDIAVQDKEAYLLKVEDDSKKKIEDIQYELAKNIERENIAAATTIAKHFNKTLIDDIELANLKVNATMKATLDQENVDAIVKDTTEKVSKDWKERFDILKNESDKNTALSTLEISQLRKANESFAKEIEYYKNQLEKSYASTKEIVAASHNNPIVVNTGDVVNSKK